MIHGYRMVLPNSIKDPGVISIRTSEEIDGYTPLRSGYYRVAVFVIFRRCLLAICLGGNRHAAESIPESFFCQQTHHVASNRRCREYLTEAVHEYLLNHGPDWLAIRQPGLRDGNEATLDATCALETVRETSFAPYFLVKPVPADQWIAPGYVLSFRARQPALPMLAAAAATFARCRPELRWPPVRVANPEPEPSQQRGEMQADDVMPELSDDPNDEGQLGI